MRQPHQSAAAAYSFQPRGRAAVWARTSMHDCEGTTTPADGSGYRPMVTTLKPSSRIACVTFVAGSTPTTR